MDKWRKTLDPKQFLPILAQELGHTKYEFPQDIKESYLVIRVLLSHRQVRFSDTNERYLILHKFTLSDNNG